MLAKFCGNGKNDQEVRLGISFYGRVFLNIQGQCITPSRVKHDAGVLREASFYVKEFGDMYEYSAQFLFSLVKF